MARGHMIDMKLKGGFDMKLTQMRRVGVAAALSVIAMAVPVSTAGAATAAPGATAAVGWDALPAVALPVTDPVAGQVATVIGPAIITTAPTTFINTNNQVTAGDSWSGGQSAP
jgi:DMSO/TMAO reductase YedYZ molybdopterin-dependent catalytic subunit